MPFSLDPQPAEDQIECARCGALIYFDLTRCPKCGVNLYEPGDDLEEGEGDDWTRPPGLFSRTWSRLSAFFRKLTGRPYRAEEVFGSDFDQAPLYKELFTRVGGDAEVLERLIQFERRRMPSGNRRQWLESALRRWNRDNRIT